jgi:hypothetical protein
MHPPTPFKPINDHGSAPTDDAHIRTLNAHAALHHVRVKVMSEIINSFISCYSFRFPAQILDVIIFENLNIHNPIADTTNAKSTKKKEDFFVEMV